MRGRSLLLTLLGAVLLFPAVAQAERDRRVCGPEVKEFARCHALVAVDAKGHAMASATPTGLNPVDLRSAYKLTTATTGGTGKTIAIVDAFDDPNAAADLTHYRAQFGIPACTTTTGCFRKVNQTGGTAPPAGNASWGQEISLDLDMASAICPNCKILLVEATTSSIVNLGTAVNTAARLGASAISNSYGGGEFSSEASYDAAFYHHPGIAVVASSGDSGYGVQFPAASQYVTAVGGTTLVRSTNARGWSETAWSGAGSGCSAFEPKPTWQHDTGCARRTVADVSADANPGTGVSVYDTYGSGGWLKFGGTSVAAPIIAGVYELGTAPVTFGSNPYAHPTSLFDVIGGSNGSCGGSYLCTSVAGYDGPTGLGTPNGAGAF
jgi:subtilase family serine protease